MLRRFVAPDAPDKKGKGETTPVVTGTVDDILPETETVQEVTDTIDDILFESDPKRVDDYDALQLN